MSKETEEIREMILKRVNENTDPNLVFLLGILTGHLDAHRKYESFLKSVIAGGEKFDPEVQTFDWFQDTMKRMEKKNELN